MTRDDDNQAFLPGRGLVAEIDVSGLSDDGDAVWFDFTTPLGRQAQGFVMRWGDGWVAYENRCPHWSVPIATPKRPGFLHPDGAHIYCPMHGARFTPETGECVEGPCVGDGLERFVVKVVDEETVRVERSGRRLGLPSVGMRECENGRMRKGENGAEDRNTEE